MSEKRLRVEQLPSGVLFLRLAMGQERFGSLEALRESQTLALSIIKSLTEMSFTPLESSDHALRVSKLSFERLLSIGWGRFWGFCSHLAPVLGKVRGLL